DAKQIRERPIIDLLVAHGAMSTGLQRAHQSTQKVRVAVVPIGNDRLIEEREAGHAATLSRAYAAWYCCTMRSREYSSARRRANWPCAPGALRRSRHFVRKSATSSGAKKHAAPSHSSR